MSEQAAVLAVNGAFYQAFARGDFAAMELLWSRGPKIACNHPGAPPLCDRVSVMRSWREILTQGPTPQVRCRDEQVYLLGTTAFVVCLEQIGGAHLAATNIFVKEEDGAWRLMHHQSGPLAQRSATSVKPPPQHRLH